MNDKIYPSMVIRSQAEAIELLEKENKQLQSNWNSLREYIREEWYCFDNESVEHEVAKNILDKMNELEKVNEYERKNI